MPGHSMVLEVLAALPVQLLLSSCISRYMFVVVFTWLSVQGFRSLGVCSPWHVESRSGCVWGYLEYVIPCVLFPKTN